MGEDFRMIQYPFAYASNEILIHKKCEEELRDLVQKSGQVARLKSDYKARLDFLGKHLENAIAHREWFEKLTDEKDLYSLRLVRISNIRILYVIQEGTAYLLCAFAERSDSRRARYESFTPVAHERQKQI